MASAKHQKGIELNKHGALLCPDCSSECLFQGGVRVETRTKDGRGSAVSIYDAGIPRFEKIDANDGAESARNTYITYYCKVCTEKAASGEAPLHPRPVLHIQEHEGRVYISWSSHPHTKK